MEPGRIYPDYHTMLEEEAKRTGEDRLDFVVVATPNNTHYEIVKDIIAHGFHIVCDKPVTFTSRESEELKALAQEKDLLFGVSYSYAHYAILEQAKKMIADGVLGKIHTIAAEYPQEWVGLNTALRGKDGLTWRVDPAICGPSGVIADIGTHVEYLISKVTGLKPVRVLARLRSIPEYVPVERCPGAHRLRQRGSGHLLDLLRHGGQELLHEGAHLRRQRGHGVERPRFHGAPGGHRRTAHPDLVGQL